MKCWLLSILLLSGAALAGDYYGAVINSYDPVSGLYYRAIEERVEREGLLGSKGSTHRIVNINIFDPLTQQSTVLFNQPQKEGIALLLFETGFKTGSIEFNGSAYHGTVLNNHDIQQRVPRDKLLIGVKEKHTIGLFISSRRGENMRRLAVVPAGAEWHIDIKNAKVRIVHPLPNALRIESYDW